MANGQGINLRLKRVKQTGLGVPGSAGSQIARRTSVVFKKDSDTFTNAEIVDHQQSTGDNEGTYSVSGKLAGLLSTASYAPEFANLLRKDFVATANITGMGVTIAAAGPAWTLTRSAGDFLTGGIKVGDLVRLTVGGFNAANLNRNFLVLAVTALALTVVPLNNTALVAEGPITGATLAVPGKKAWVPTSGHTDTFFSWELWRPDVPASNLYTDVKVSAAQIQIPASGNPTVSFDFAGLGRTPGTAEVLTAPTLATTTAVLASAQGKAVVNGAVTVLTSADFTITGNVQAGEAEIGQQARSGHQVGRIAVSGTFSAKFSSMTLQAIRDNQNVIPLIFTVAADNSAGADAIVFVLNAAKLFTDEENDGETEVIRQYAFTAQIPATGGAALANHQTIISLQDTQAP